MLHVQHFVEEHVFDGVARHGGPVQPAVHNDLIECRIEAAELCPPGPVAPAKPRTMQPPAEIPAVEAGEHRREIVNGSARLRPDAAASGAAKRGNAPPSPRQEDKLAIGAKDFAGRATPINARQENGRGRFQDRRGRPAQGIRKAYASGFFSQAYGVHQIGVRIKFHFKARRTPPATQTRINPLKDRGASGNGTGTFGCASHCGLRRTGGGAFSLMASAASLIASLVASMASFRLSL